MLVVECSGRRDRQTICFNPKIRARVRQGLITPRTPLNLRLQCPTFSLVSSNSNHNKQVAQCIDQYLQGLLVGQTTTRLSSRYLARLSQFSNDKQQHKCQFLDNRIIKTIISNLLKLLLWREVKWWCRIRHCMSKSRRVWKYLTTCEQTMNLKATKRIYWGFWASPVLSRCHHSNSKII